MRIIRRKFFDQNLKSILIFIAKDSRYQAKRFKNRLKSKTAKLPNMPYKFRQSFYHNDQNIRDMIFKGYTIPYLIDLENDTLVLLDIFKWVDK